VELQGRHKELQAQGIGLATISYDSREVIAAFSKQHGITYPMLSDQGSATIKRYGILNTVVAEAFGPNKDDPAVKADVAKYISIVNPSPNMQGIAFPGTFMLDRRGRVTSRFFEDFYIERNTVSSVMKRLGVGGPAVAGTKSRPSTSSSPRIRVSQPLHRATGSRLPLTSRRSGACTCMRPGPRTTVSSR
jgi:peroxiredoxin